MARARGPACQSAWGQASLPCSLPRLQWLQTRSPPPPPPTWQASRSLSWGREPSVLGLHHRVNNLSALGKQGRSKWRNSDSI